MDLAPRGIDARAMLRDTFSSFEQVPVARAEFLATLAASVRKRLEAHVTTVRAGLRPEDAHIDIPSRDPSLR